MAIELLRDRSLQGHGSRRRERGNALVEMALVLMPLMAMVLAIIDFSMPIFMKSTFTHAVREGARYAITYQTSGGQGHIDSIKTVVQNNASGFLTGATGWSRIEVKFFSPVTFVEVTGANANVSGNIVEVAVRGYQWGWIAPLWRTATPLTINAASSDRLETLPASIPRPAP